MPTPSLPLEFYIELAAVILAGIGALGVSTKKILAALRRNWEETQHMEDRETLRDCIERIERSVEEVRALNRGYLNLTGGGIFTADASGSCTWVSRQFTDMTGVAPEDAGGTGWLAGVSNDDRLRVHDEWTMFVQSRGGIEFNSLFSTSTGIPVRGRAVPIEADCRAVDSGVSGFFGQLRRET